MENARSLMVSLFRVDWLLPKLYAQASVPISHPTSCAIFSTKRGGVGDIGAGHIF